MWEPKKKKQNKNEKQNKTKQMLDTMVPPYAVKCELN